MELNKEIKREIYVYMEHIPSLEWIGKLFDFIRDDELRERIIQEYYNARYVYKFFEGMSADGEMLKSESRLQVIMYANIYEAVIHHVLFSLYHNNPLVKELFFSNELIRWSVNDRMKHKLEECIIRTTDDKNIRIIPCKFGKTKKSDAEIKSCSKASCAKQLGLIDDAMCTLITEIYSLRNGIHLHAELRKRIDWDLSKAKEAFWHIEGFIQQIKSQLQKDGLYRPS